MTPEAIKGRLQFHALHTTHEPEAARAAIALLESLQQDLSIARAEVALLRGRPVDVDEFNRATAMRDRLALALRRLLADAHSPARYADAEATLEAFDRDRDTSRRVYLADEYRSGLDSPPRR